MNASRYSAELEQWLMNPMTQRFQRLVLESFDHQRALLGTESGVPIDKLKGRAEVMQYIIDPTIVLAPSVVNTASIEE